MLCPPTFSGGIVLALCLFIHIDSSVAGRQDSPAQEEYPEEYLVLLGDATAGSRVPPTSVTAKRCDSPTHCASPSLIHYGLFYPS